MTRVSEGADGGRRRTRHKRELCGDKWSVTYKRYLPCLETTGLWPALHWKKAQVK